MQDYTTIAGVLRLREEKVSQRDIVAKYGIGKGTVVRVLEKAKSLGIDYDKIKDMDPDEVIEKFYNMSLPRSTKPQPDFDADAILDRLVYHAYRIELKGKSMRK